MATREHILFGRLAMLDGLLSSPELEECLDRQRELESLRQVRRIGSIMVEAGYLDARQVLALLRKQQKAMLHCRQCDIMVNVIGFQRDADYLCRQCETPLVMVQHPKTLEFAYSIFADTENETGRSSGDALIGQILGGLKIEERLGEGGMGAVYKARHLALGRDVAVKILTPALAANRQYVDRFIREARVVAQLEHENVVRVFDIGKEKGRRYISMEYVDGSNLGAVLEEQGHLSTTESIRIVIQVCKGLKGAQERGIIHRDIKPENILLTSRNTVKVADFGLATQIQDFGTNITHAGQIIGSPHFMSPEQCSGDSLDGRSDIYSLGATFYYMITGRYPFDGETPLSIMLKHQKEKLTSPRVHRPDIPDAVCYIIEKMMEKNPNHRYPTLEYLSQDLEKVLHGEKPDLVMFAQVRSEIEEAPPANQKKNRERHPKQEHQETTKDRQDRIEEIRAKENRVHRWILFSAVEGLLLCGLLLYAVFAAQSSNEELAQLSGELDSVRGALSEQKQRNMDLREDNQTLHEDVERTASDASGSVFQMVESLLENDPGQIEWQAQLLSAYLAYYPDGGKYSMKASEQKKRLEEQLARRTKLSAAEAKMRKEVDALTQKRAYRQAVTMIETFRKSWKGKSTDLLAQREYDLIRERALNDISATMFKIAAIALEGKLTRAKNLLDLLKKEQALDFFPKKQQEIQRLEKSLNQAINARKQKRKESAKTGFQDLFVQILEALKMREFQEARDLLQSISTAANAVMTQEQARHIHEIIDAAESAFHKGIDNLMQHNLNKYVSCRTRTGHSIDGILLGIDGDRMTIQSAEGGTLSWNIKDLATQTVLAFAYGSGDAWSQKDRLEAMALGVADGDLDFLRQNMKMIDESGEKGWILRYVNMVMHMDVHHE